MLIRHLTVVRRILIYLAVGCGLVTAAFALWLFRRPLPFDSEVWKQNPDATRANNFRNRMANDLAERVLRPGVPRAEVIRLLGAPNSSFTPGESYGATTITSPTDGYWLYKPLADVEGIGYNTEFLKLEYDKSGRLLRASRDIYAT